MLRLPPKRPELALTHGILAMFAVAGVALFAAGPEASHRVTAVRFWSLQDVTRIAIETDGDFHLRSDKLTNPERIFFDLEGTRPSLGSKAMTVIQVSDPLVERIRVAEPQRNTTRVVVDLSQTVVVSTSRLENPNRLIIEVRTAPPGDPAKSAPRSAPPAPVTAVAMDKPPAPEPVIEQKLQEEAVKLPAQKLRADRRPFHPPDPQPAAPPPSPQPIALLEPPTVKTNSSAPSATLAAAMNPRFTLAKPAAPPPLAASASPTAPVATATPLPTAAEASAPAKRMATGDRSMIRALGLKISRIVLDPGHGGHDTGTVGPNGLKEKDLVLDVVQRLGTLIEERMGSEVIYTRTDDTFIPLERRTEIANEAKADLFLSIHANSSTLQTAAGVETFYLNFTTSRAALDLASRENAGSEKTVFELQDLLQKIALSDKVEESKEFASRIENSLAALSVKNNARAKDRGVKKAPFVVLIGASMPSVLTEIGFVSNAHDEATMKRPDYRARIAEALFKGITGYANSLSHFQVAQRQ